jgi:hypothetical protein
MVNLASPVPIRMTVQQAEFLLVGTGVAVAVQQRFAFDTGTMLRLDNYAIINIFDDGRYYIQGENIEALVLTFGLVQEAWDPDSWAGEMPNHAQKQVPKEDISTDRPFEGPGKRFDF